MSKCNFGNDTCKNISNFECPYCHKHLTMNPRQYANHIRWCEHNPQYNHIKENSINKIKKSSEIRLNKKLGEYKNFYVSCCKCGCKFIIKERELKFNPDKKYYCSKSCANSHIKTEESKQKTRDTYKEKYKSLKPHLYNDKYYKYKKICGWCKQEYYTNKEEQKFCCSDCVLKYRNNEYINKLKNGSYKEQLKLYRKQCEFKFSLNQFPEEFDFELIKNNGWYKAKNHGDNLHGISRDHMFSVKEGFRQNVDPYLLSHPANCQLLIHTDNESKYSKCSITLEELKERVEKWNIKYGEYPNLVIY